MNVTEFANCTYALNGTLYLNASMLDVCGVCLGNTSTCICDRDRILAIFLLSAFILLLGLILWGLARLVAFPASRGSVTLIPIVFTLVTWAALSLPLIAYFVEQYQQNRDVCDFLRGLDVLYAPAALFILVAAIFVIALCSTAEEITGRPY
jgi:hypothetical protein